MGKIDKIEEWFLAYGSDVHHFLVYYLGRSNVEDLVQDVFVKALKGMDRYEGRASPKTWLFSIARRVALDEARKKKWHTLLSARIRSETDVSRSAEEIVFQREDTEGVYRVIRRLKTSYRDVLLLRVMQDFSPEETAAILGWTRNRVNVTLHRALIKVRELYLREERSIGHGEFER
ncbi:sigma-70 family RNA polymerase sigma factor [Cohnella sp. CFH 77786]|uniref:RNA polymerase sigma factor n=1 Tax=Cohnella sp. CFH 77786 TaxID=2662265 RepID=UPI001C60DE4C|nr:sigma-70 family RNA polymerase sigma factor [Cohnella sp. CFH 77786]MBW5444777.1 sigma-70 family RNA polymerase sigma factor [Cohnella sp. CFH 77786]